MLNFNAYWIMCIISGILMLVLAGVDKNRNQRIYNLIFGAGFLLYGLYLVLFFKGGHFLEFYYVFVLPIIAIANLVKARNAHTTSPQMPAGWQQPGQPQPGAWPQQPGVQYQPPAQYPPAPPAGPSLTSDDVLKRS